jgi:homocysteine S-methyltransferase
MKAIADGGMETTLIYHGGAELPHFASFVLLETEEGRELLRSYYRPYLEIAQRHGVAAILDTATWRANTDWGGLLGYTPPQLRDANARAVELLRELRAGWPGVQVVISGCIGPRGDGYVVGETMTVDEAAAYHAPQVEALVDAGADLVTALTMTYPDEAAGIAAVARANGIPSVVSFTVETDGRLPDGHALRAAIDEVDVSTAYAPDYYMVNCAHPTHFRAVLAEGPIERLRGVRANASALSHEELDAAEELDEGDPDALAADYVELRRLLPVLDVVGGCCGTDHRHIEAIAGTFRA